MLSFLMPCVRSRLPLQRSSWSPLLTRFTSSSQSHQQQAKPEDGSRGEVKPFSAIPGPKGLPLLGNVLDMAKNTGKAMPYFTEQLKIHGDIIKIEIPGNDMVVISDPNSLETILRAEGKYPDRDKAMTSRTSWFYKQSGVPVPFSQEKGEAWKKGRMQTKNQIIPRNVNSYIPGLAQVFARFTDYLRGARDDSNMIEDFAELTPKLLTEVSAKFVYDADLQIVANPKEEDLQFLSDVNKLFDCLGKLVYFVIPTYKVYANKLYRDFTAAVKGIREFGSKHAKAVQVKIDAGEEPGEVQGLLEQWLREEKMTRELALSLSSEMFMAGVHTTAHQSSFLMYEMAKHPEVQEKLLEEIKYVLGDRQPTAEDIENMPYAKGCVMESFRVRPTAGGFTRVLKEDTTILGYKVPAGTTVLYTSRATGMKDDIFKDPEKFLPERWGRDYEAKHHPFALLPLGFGPRVCWGKRFAELELKLLVIEMTRNFHVSTDMEDLKMTEVLLTLPDEKLTLRLEDRK